MNKRIFWYVFGAAAGALAALFLALWLLELLIVNWLSALCFILLMAVCALNAYRVARAVVGPIERIDPGHPETAAVYPELIPLVQRLTEQYEQILRQMSDLRAAHEAQDAMRRDFTANVSHELKTPLTSISGYAEIIEGGIAKAEDVPRFAGKIREEAGRLVTLVGDIIELNELDGREIHEPVTEVQLKALCQGVLERLELPAREKAITLALEGEECSIQAPEKIVEEIVFNVCDNAVKYNKEGGRVDVSLRRCMDGVELTISDTGIGIPAEDLPHVFERFFRVDKSHSKAVGGTGLGLSIVKHGIQYLGAALNIESTPGEGTKVSILF